jgi:hypothetical protein
MPPRLDTVSCAVRTSRSARQTHPKAQKLDPDRPANPEDLTVHHTQLFVPVESLASSDAARSDIHLVRTALSAIDDRRPFGR